MKRWPLEALFAGSGGVAFPRMTALVGAGGKTTLMYALARRMADAGRRVVCTTTTKIFPPEDGLPVVLLEGAADPVAAVHDALSAAPCVVAAGRPLPDVRKLDGVSPRMLAVLSAALPAALFLVEADGAARKPLKAPAAHEPSGLLRGGGRSGQRGAAVGRRARAPFRTGLRGGGAGAGESGDARDAGLSGGAPRRAVPQLSGGVPPSRVRQ